MPKRLRDEFGWKVGDEVAFLREEDGAKITRAPRRRRGRAIIERLKQAPWNRKLTTETLMAMTRGAECAGGATLRP